MVPLSNWSGGTVVGKKQTNHDLGLLLFFFPLGRHSFSLWKRISLGFSKSRCGKAAVVWCGRLLCVPVTTVAARALVGRHDGRGCEQKPLIHDTKHGAHWLRRTSRKRLNLPRNQRQLQWAPGITVTNTEQRSRTGFPSETVAKGSPALRKWGGGPLFLSSFTARRQGQAWLASLG